MTLTQALRKAKKLTRIADAAREKAEETYLTLLNAEREHKEAEAARREANVAAGDANLQVRSLNNGNWPTD